MNFLFNWAAITLAGILALNNWVLPSAGVDTDAVADLAVTEDASRPDIEVALEPRGDILDGYQVVRLVNNERKAYQPVRVACATSRWPFLNHPAESPEFRIERRARARVKMPLETVGSYESCKVLA